MGSITLLIDVFNNKFPILIEDLLDRHQTSHFL